MFLTLVRIMTYRHIYFLFLFFSFTAVNCQIGGYSAGTFYNVSSQPLSLHNPHLRTCIFDPHYSIVHFPLYHFTSGYLSPQERENITQSEFQLLHTILAYKGSRRPIFVFDERITVDGYDSQYFQMLSSGSVSPTQSYTRIDGKEFFLVERFQRARHLFGNNIPDKYEYLSPEQKQFIFNTGAPRTLYLLGKIDRLYKVISKGSFDLVKGQTHQGGVIQGQEYWIFDFREQELRKEVLNFLQTNPGLQGLIFVSYGADHDFSDEFAGLSFQSGHSFCLNWQNHSPPVLP